MTLSTNALIMILGMALVTLIPRILPVPLVKKLHFGPKAEKFLRLIPYTAMAALIFPSILSTDADRIYIGLVGGGVAALLAWFKMPLIVCVIGSVGVNMLLYAFIP